MNNPLFNMMNQQQNGLLQKFEQFRRSFQGDPRQQIQQMLNTGQISQQQYNSAVQMAQQFQKMLGK